MTICPLAVSPKQVRMGRCPARRLDWMGPSWMRTTRPTEAEALDVDELGLEDAGGHGPGAGAELLERLDEAQVLAR